MPINIDDRPGEYLGLVDPALRLLTIAEQYRFFRQKIWERDQGLCQLCGKPVELGRGMHLDHIIMRLSGGETHWDNLRITHASCNIRRPHLHYRGPIKHRNRLVSVSLSEDEYKTLNDIADSRSTLRLPDVFRWLLHTEIDKRRLIRAEAARLGLAGQEADREPTAG